MSRATFDQIIAVVCWVWVAAMVAFVFGRSIADILASPPACS
ncbi:hypothetical protein [Prosthecomicrobium hirschii]|nr:hypothetical protein [Prosthecomicrobium hirschii]MCW1839469.1 hypothetical protein [Prosthecomicrobium hirschii]